jgi:short-subunit dehydrogenase
MNKKIILITGASSGVGECLAKQLTEKHKIDNGLDSIELILLARGEKSLVSVAKNLGGHCRVFACDLTKQCDLENLFSEVPQIDELYHCAGFGTVGKTVDIQIENHLQILDLNCKATVSLNYFYSKKMKDQGRGKILNISSVAGFLSIPYFNTYAASKAFVTSFSEALAFELKDTNVEVKVYCPGGIMSKFHLKAGLQDQIIEDNKLFLITPEQAAIEIINQMNSRKKILIPGFINKFTYLLTKFIPRAILLKQSGELYRKYLK